MLFVTGSIANAASLAKEIRKVTALVNIAADTATKEAPDNLKFTEAHTIAGYMATVLQSHDLRRIARALKKQGGLNLEGLAPLRELLRNGKIGDRETQIYDAMLIWLLAGADFETTAENFSFIFVELSNEKYRNFANYQKALKFVGHYAGYCDRFPKQPNRKIPELCITGLGIEVLRNEGKNALALDWARDQLELVQKLAPENPVIQLDALLSLAELELVAGNRDQAIPPVKKAFSLKRKHEDLLNDFEFRIERSNGYQIRNNFSERLGSLRQVLRPDAINQDTISTFDEQKANQLLDGFIADDRSTRPLDVARLLKAARSNKYPAPTITRIKAGILRTLEGIEEYSLCSQAKKNTGRKLDNAILTRSFAGIGLVYCDFVYEKEISEKRKLAKKLFDNLYLELAQFGHITGFFEDILAKAATLDALDYPLAAQITREQALAMVSHDYTPPVIEGEAVDWIDEQTSRDIQLKFALDFLKATDATVARMLDKKRHVEALKTLQNANILGAHFIETRWRGSPQNLGTTLQQTQHLFTRLARNWFRLSWTTQKFQDPAHVDGTLGMVQLAQLGDVALAQQAGVRRNLASRPKAVELLDQIIQNNRTTTHIVSMTSSYGDDTTSPKPWETGFILELEKLEQTGSTLKKRLKQELPLFSDFPSIAPVSLNDLKTSLPDGHFAAIYLPFEDALGTIFATNQVAIIVPMPVTSAEITRKVGLLRAGLDPNTIDISNPKTFDLKTAHELYRHLFRAADRLFDNATHLRLVTSGALSSLPFHVLIRGKEIDTNTSDFRNVNWLMKSHAVTVHASVRGIAAPRTSVLRNQDRPNTLFGVGDPDFGNRNETAGARSIDINQVSYLDDIVSFEGTSIPPLPDTRSELGHISVLLGRENTHLNFGDMANESEIKSLSEKGELLKFSILYFATHGLVAGELDGNNEPGLVLSIPDIPDAENDGLLTASEIAALKLDADWVILSACNTASGETLEAEALSGLAQAFYKAGARSLLVSHWPVISTAAVELTTGTFDNLDRNPSITRAEALRQSMNTILNKGKSRAHPAYWAPFILAN